MWAMVPEIVSLELMIGLAHNHDIVWDNLELEMLKREANLPKTLYPLDVSMMNTSVLANAMKTIDVAWQDLLENLGEFFWPKPNNVLYK